MIAIRALRAAKELGYQVASVYSTVDKDQKHLKLSDEAICIGPAASKESYLNEAAIISAAELVGCLLYTSPSPRDKRQSRMPSSA